MARRRQDPCLRNARKGEKIFNSAIKTGLKMTTNSSSESSDSGCLYVLIIVILLFIFL